MHFDPPEITIDDHIRMQRRGQILMAGGDDRAKARGGIDRAPQASRDNGSGHAIEQRGEFVGKQNQSACGLQPACVASLGFHAG